MTAGNHDPLGAATTLLDALYCGAVIIARDGRISHVNSRFCAMMERQPDELLGRELAGFYEADVAEKIRRKVAEFDGDREAEGYLPLPGGRRLPVVLASKMLGAEPPFSSYRVTTFIDISSLKAAQEHISRQYEEICKLTDTIVVQALDLKRHAGKLEERVRQRTQALHEANLDAVHMLAVAAEARDTDTGEHVMRIRGYTIRLAQAIGIAESEAEEMGRSAILHDVGKIHIPDSILKKPGSLTSDERRQMESHTSAGAAILSAKPFFHRAREIARHHHENWDGTGYPDALSGEHIPLAARIVRVVDVFDALRSQRVYKPAWPLERAVAALRDGSGTLFDPRLVEGFLPLAASGGDAR